MINEAIEEYYRKYNQPPTTWQKWWVLKAV
jgi:hypothetical protein